MPDHCIVTLRDLQAHAGLRTLIRGVNAAVEILNLIEQNQDLIAQSNWTEANYAALGLSDDLAAGACAAKNALKSVYQQAAAVRASFPANVV